MSEETDIPDSIKDIELTEEGKEPIKEVEFVRDEERAEVLEDPVRLAIITVLRKGIEDKKTTERVDDTTGDKIIRESNVQRYALSVVEIVKRSAEIEMVDEITKNQVYHHLPKLIDAGYVIKFGTVTTGKRTTDYYRRTAKGFVLTKGDMKFDEKHLRAKTTRSIERMSSVFDLGLTEKEKERLIELKAKRYELHREGRDMIAGLITSDVADKEILGMYEWLLDTYATGNPEWFEVQKEIHNIIFKDKR